MRIEWDLILMALALAIGIADRLRQRKKDRLDQACERARRNLGRSL